MVKICIYRTIELKLDPETPTPVLARGRSILWQELILEMTYGTIFLGIVVIYIM